jgi:two-component system chemotaxis response regulator CheY
MQSDVMEAQPGGDISRLPAAIDTTAADAFLGFMRQHASASRPVRFDASGVEILTVAGVQVILAVARDHGPITVVNPSEAFLIAFGELGIDWTTVLNFEVRADEDAPSVSPQGETDMAAAAHDQTPISERTMTKRIMTIDDSKTMRDMLMLTLVEAGYDVLQAVDGQDGLDKLATERVDVVITDINMPKMDGYEVVRRLRDTAAYRSTPILVLTTEAETEKRDIARKAGATGWMVKPFDPDRLVEAVRKVIQ